MMIEINLPRPRNPLIALARNSAAPARTGRTVEPTASAPPSAPASFERNEAHPMT